MEPFTSNDTYACPDCGAEVRVGARSCPGCGPFRPMEWSEDESQEPHETVTPAGAFHSHTSYTDTREILEKSRRPVKNSLPLPPEGKPQNFQALFISLLVILTLLAVAMAAFKMLRYP